MHPEIEMVETRRGRWEPVFVVERRQWRWRLAKVAGHLALYAFIASSLFNFH